MLPPMCFVRNDETGLNVVILRGQSGYLPIATTRPTSTADADALNGQFGITKAQVAAMKVGSMFGWTVPGANPERYNEDGSPR